MLIQNYFWQRNLHTENNDFIVASRTHWHRSTQTDITSCLMHHTLNHIQHSHSHTHTHILHEHQLNNINNDKMCSPAFNRNEPRKNRGTYLSCVVYNIRLPLIFMQTNQQMNQTNQLFKNGLTSRRNQRTPMQKPSHDKLYEIWELWYDWLNQKRTLTQPLCHLSRFNLLATGEGLSKIPPFERIQIEIEFHFPLDIWPKKILNKRKNEQTQCRVCIFLQNIWQIKRKRRHINSSKIIDPFENNRQIRHQPTKFCQRPFFTRPKLFHIRTFCCWCCSWGEKTKKSHNYDAIHCQIVHELDNWYGQLTQLHAKQTKCRNISKHLSHCLNAGQKCAKKSD